MILILKGSMLMNKKRMAVGFWTCDVHFRFDSRSYGICNDFEVDDFGPL